MSTTNLNLETMPRPLLDWYDKNRRSMVWRDNPTPYNVWISEIMLQQTRIEAAKAYFLRFTKEIPDIRSLAEIPEERLLKLWEGLGYYNRARNLQKTAKLLVERYEGNMPADYDLLLELPGIGPYTAGAISSIAYNKKAAAVDGNVLRVVTRYLELSDDIMKMSFRRKVEKELLRIMPERPGDFNQAIMELGEVICIPNGEPLCEKCPLRKNCQAFLNGTQEKFPVKTEKKKRRIEKRTILIVEQNGKIAIRKRQDKGLLAGLWEFPSLDGKKTKTEVRGMLESSSEINALEPCIHIFSHVEWHMTGYHILLKSGVEIPFLPHDVVWVEKNQIKNEYTLPVAFHRFRDQIGANEKS